MLLIRVGSDYSSSAGRVVLLCHMLGSSSGGGPVVSPRIRARISLVGVLMASVSREARRGESWLVVARRSRPGAGTLRWHLLSRLGHFKTHL